MSKATDIRTYADTAVSQGKHMLGQAQTQLNGVTGQATELYGKTRGNVSELAGKTRGNVSELAGKATGAVTDLRASAEKAINVDAIKTAVEPYLAQVKDYRGTVTDRAETLLAGVKGDPRVAKLVDTAGSLTAVVIGTVQERIVKPAQSLTGRGAKPVAEPAESVVPVAEAAEPVTPVPTAAAKPAGKPAVTRPAAATPATKPAARKAPARKATES